MSGIPGFMYFCSGFVSAICILALFGVSETKDSYLSDTICGSKLTNEEVNLGVNEAKVEMTCSVAKEDNSKKMSEKKCHRNRHEGKKD